MMTQEDRDLSAIEAFITDSMDDRPFAKAMEDAEDELQVKRGQTEQKEDETDEHLDPNGFPATREGLAAFIDSTPMQRLMVDKPQAFQLAWLSFALGKELVRRGEVSAEEISAGVQRGHLWQNTTPSDRELVAKAVSRSIPKVTPWRHPRTLQGLTDFAKSDPMQTLKRESMGDWTQCVLDFLTSIPRITPNQISEVRLRLESTQPDRQFVKGLGDLSNQLTSGQSVLMKNFGADLADPDRWMIPR
jgi:hypothetical protein